ncbi:MAG: HipA N-terminal domain-containing protein [candidate division WOR-3 bacterium]|nr:HipA N-terminal domain-containing protein [candidate division WOR-3 bacterium]
MKTNRRGEVYFNNDYAGFVMETSDGYLFEYDREYMKKGIPISVSLPFTQRTHESEHLHVFFQSLLPEGWYKAIISKKLKIDENDDFGFLLKSCSDTIGAVSIRESDE